MADTGLNTGGLKELAPANSESTPFGGSPERSAAFIESGAMLIDAMANSTRLMVLSRLVKGEMSVGALGKLVGISQSALSQHLAKLRGAGLVITRRDAQMVYYSCTSLAVIRILAQLGEYFPDGL